MSCSDSAKALSKLNIIKGVNAAKIRNFILLTQPLAIASFYRNMLQMENRI
jgi:hypothetical protein